MKRNRRPSAGAFNYSDLLQPLAEVDESQRVDYRWLYQMVLAYENQDGDCQELLPESLTPEWFESTGLQEPVVVRACDDAPGRMGMRLPEKIPLTVSSIVESIGRDRKVLTIDVAQQHEGPKLTLGQWEEYWNGKCHGSVLSGESLLEDGRSSCCRSELKVHRSIRSKLLNVVSLSLAGSPLESQIEPPRAVQECETVKEVWPSDAPDIPKVLKFVLMSPTGAYTDFHLDYGGSSVWYHVVSGRKTFLVVPPSGKNLQMFTAWAASSRQKSVFLGHYVKGMVKIELCPGDTILLPGGWPHAVATSEQSLVLGGNFLHKYNLRLQLEVWRIEDYLGVKPKYQFPHFQELMWYTAHNFLESVRRLKSIAVVNEGSNCSGPGPQAPAQKQSESRSSKTRTVQPETDQKLTMSLRPRHQLLKTTPQWYLEYSATVCKKKRSTRKFSRWEAEGLALLLYLLSQWIVTFSEDSIPSSIKKPKTVLERLSRALQKMDCKPPLAMRKVELIEAVPQLMEEFKPSFDCKSESEVDSSKDLDWVGNADDFHEVEIDNCREQPLKKKRPCCPKPPRFP